MKQPKPMRPSKFMMAYRPREKFEMRSIGVLSFLSRYHSYAMKAKRVKHPMISKAMMYAVFQPTAGYFTSAWICSR
jgi:hypothetical protein